MPTSEPGERLDDGLGDELGGWSTAVIPVMGTSTISMPKTGIRGSRSMDDSAIEVLGSLRQERSPGFVLRGSRRPPSELEEPRDLEGYQPLKHLPSFGVTALGQHKIHIGKGRMDPIEP